MLSVLQCLFGIDEFRRQMMAYSNGKYNTNTGFAAIVEQISSMGFFSRKFGVVSVKKFFNFVAQVNPTFGRQEGIDANEFLQWILIELQSTVSGVRYDKAKYDPKAQPTWVQNLFEIIVGNSFRCLCCESVTMLPESAWTLSLDVDANTSLPELYRYFIRTETLKLNEKKYCDKCKTFQEIDRSNKLMKLPRNLIVHMKRLFPIDKINIKKLDYKILFPLEMRFGVQSGGPFPEDRLYDLKGVVVHNTPGLKIGHYYALVKYGDIWLKFDDTAISVI